MKFSIYVNQKRIIELGLNIEKSSLKTWALFDYLFDYAKTKTDDITQNEKAYKIINYKSIQKALFIANFNNRSIKQHLDILVELKIIELYKDYSNNIYFRFLPLALEIAL